MSNAQFAAAVSVLISATLLIVIWLLLRSWRDDNLRDQLFSIRDDMFLYAIDRGIADNSAHENLRLLINSLIRYAHRISLGRLLLLGMCQRVFKVRADPPKTYVEWIQAVDALPAADADRMRGYHDQAMLLIMKHMIKGSPWLWCVSVVIGLYVVIFTSARVFLVKSTRAFLDRIVYSVRRQVPSMDLFEADALRTT